VLKIVLYVYVTYNILVFESLLRKDCYKNTNNTQNKFQLIIQGYTRMQ